MQNEIVPVIVSIRECHAKAAQFGQIYHKNDWLSQRLLS